MEVITPFATSRGPTLGYLQTPTQLSQEKCVEHHVSMSGFHLLSYVSDFVDFLTISSNSIRFNVG